jgi:hypothetical protein
VKLFYNTVDLSKEKKENSLAVPWLSVDIISSNCPIHLGKRLKRLADNSYQCPEGKEIYKAHSSVTNQTSKDRYDLGMSIK